MRPVQRSNAVALVASALISASAGAASADSGDDPGGDVATTPQRWALHVQGTNVTQYHPAFASKFQGQNSLGASAELQATFDVTAYAGLRAWQGGEIWINPEIDQGFGLSSTFGVAGFPSGEAYKVGSHIPYGRLHRAFLRQTFDLGGERSRVEADLNQLAGSQSSDRIVLTVGKFSVVDVFDNNLYAHDPRNDFLNWALIDSAAFDYAANAWGYTYGAAGERYQGNWTLRAGLFELSVTPNSTALDNRLLPQYQGVLEIERRYRVADQPGAARLLGFITHGAMGAYDQATAQAQRTGDPADIAAVRSPHTKRGFAVGLQQQVSTDAGVFARLSGQQGRYEAFDFTDVARSYAAGLSTDGAGWHRADDAVGAAVVVNQASSAAQRFFDAGGLGILVGDGRLPRPGPERIAEVYYRFALRGASHVTLDYQYVRNPAFNRDRGPVSVLGLRLHGQM